ncbi:MAG: threonine synthase [Geminicoccaceae bacterium]|nr:threonine synthase [Geminicoccaceae bacterium]MCS7267034.1 threonine synthase [Geminicoccaceae bacterium]MDW8123345.1 threonine synthase [Geminicoccaceae bacterium]MDW8341555.1 threonine synthase [Geminicoccaceae bacterium]
MMYLSTRGRAGRRSFEEVLLAGLAEDGGLFLPERWPALDRDRLEALDGADYPATAAAVLAPFAEGCFEEDELLAMAREAYAGFAHPAVAPLRQLDPSLWLLELFFGPTLAFKDFALQLLARMFERVLVRRDETITILGATSGDTGSAAIAAVAGRRRMRVLILHPHERVSPVQRRQMTTVDAPNVANVAIRGTFDDCQNIVKVLFNDAAFRKEAKLAAVNSINWARIAAQAAYYVYAALRLGCLRRPVGFCVPTGNFGDVYAGHVARCMGLPVHRLLVATNRNDILARFFESGEYRAGEVVQTSSPSMDIQVASNFERLLFELVDGDGAAVAQLMNRFAQERGFAVSSRAHARARALFEAGTADDEQTRATIARWYERTGGAVLVDPHTAVGLAVAERLRGTSSHPLVVLATAHPAKFPEAVERATGRPPPPPVRLADLFARTERFTVLPADPAAVADFLRSWQATP